MSAIVVGSLVVFFPFTRALVLALDLAATKRDDDDYLDTYNGPNRKIRRLKDHPNFPKVSDP